MKKIFISLMTVLMCLTSFSVLAEDTEKHTHEHENETTQEVVENTSEPEIILDEGTLVVDETHADVEEKEIIYYCNKEEHTHGEECFNNYKVLICEEDHKHEEECFKEYSFLLCEKEEHIHDENCLDENYEEPIAEVDEVALEQQKQFEELLNKALNEEEGYFLNCEKVEHTHTPECFEYKEDLICKKEEVLDEEDENYHVHTDECYEKYYAIICEEKEEHVHTIDCISKNELMLNQLFGAKPSLLGAGSTLASVSGVDVTEFYIELFRGAQDIDGKKVWFPKTSDLGHEFAFRVNFAFSGIDEIPANSLEIRIPKELIKDRNGNYLDKYEIAVSRWDDFEDDDQLVYIEDGDDILVYNRLPLDAGYNGYFEVGYKMIKSTFNYSDSDPSYPDINKLGDFWAKMKLTIDEESAQLDGKDINDNTLIPFWMNSKVAISSVAKRYPNNFYYNWQSSWGTAPADAEDYYYLVWEVVTEVSDATSQPYEFRIIDTPTSQDVEAILYKLQGQNTWTNNPVQSNQTLDGKRYDFVVTRHKIATYAGVDTNIINRVTVQLTGEDGYDASVSRSASNIWRSRATKPVLQGVTKGTPSYYTSWQSSWGEAQTDADNYEYLVWPITTRIKNEARWSLAFELTDTPTSSNQEFVGYRLSGQSEFTNNNTAQINTDGIRTDYVLTRFVPQECVNMSFSNSATSTIAQVKEERPFDTQSDSDSSSYTLVALPSINSFTVGSGSKYDTWQSSWGEEPNDAADYSYIVWPVTTNISNSKGELYNLTLTENAPSGLSLVGYKMSGETTFTSNNTVTGISSAGSRTDYILTKYLKSSYSDRSFSFSNSATMQMSASTGCSFTSTTKTGTKTYSYTYIPPVIPTFNPPSEYFNSNKYGRYFYNGSQYNYNSYNYNKYKDLGYISYDLEDMKLELIDRISNVTYDIVAETNPYYYTRNSSESASNPAVYGTRPIKAEISDDEIYIDEMKLQTDDYQFDSLSYSLSIMDATYDNVNKRFVTQSPVYDQEVITLMIKVNGEWIQGGELYLKDNAVKSINSDYVNSFTRSNIDFKDGVEGYKLIIDDAKYSYTFRGTPSVSLLNSERVMEYIQDISVIDVKNVSGFILYKEGNIVKQNWSEAVDMVRSMPRDSQIKKTVAGTTNNVKKKRYTVTWSLYMDELYTELDNTKKPIEQKSGIFYDLLPISATIDLESIIVKTEDGFLKENQYNVEQIANFRDTGRNLLIVKLKYPFDYATVFYDTVHSWDSIKDYGEGLYNPVAYQTGNDVIAQGFADDGGNIEDKELFRDLNDSVTTEKKFIYDDRFFDIAVLTAAASGLTKKVRSLPEDAFTYDADTTANGDYMYRLRYMNSFTSKAKDIILFDSIENYITPDSETSDWYGILQSIDTSQLEERGIAPVIYLSSIANLDLDSNNDVTDSSVWTEMSQFGDLANAKALAIDMRKTQDNEDFILEEGASVTVIVYMKAPAVAIDKGSTYPETYNNIYVSNTVIDLYGGEQSFFIHQDYTTVRFKVSQNLPLLKVNEEDTSQTIANATFRLYGTSDYGTEVDIKKTTDEDGYLIFKDLEKGTYTLQEYEVGKDWLLDSSQHTVVIGADASLTIDGNVIDLANDEQYIFTNKPRIFSEVKLLKRREGDSAEDLEVKLMLADANIGDVVEYNGETYIVKAKPDTRVKLEKPTIKYAVSIYGIEQDTLSEDGGITTETAGLTFGPATGADYINSYKSHTPSRTTALGNEHRCVHDDDWNTIIYWNKVDPYVYEQCIGNNCTHSVELSLSDALKNPNFIPTYTGDGPSTLYFELCDSTNTVQKWQNLAWNPINNGANSGTNKDGWGASRIRAMLNGYDSLTMTKGSYRYYSSLSSIDPVENYTGANTLLSAFPEELQAVIGSKAVLYDSVYNLKTTANLATSYDKLWLLSSHEMADNIWTGSSYDHPLEAPNGKYQRFIDNNQNLSTRNSTYFQTYFVKNNTGGSSGERSYGLWLRSSASEQPYYVLEVTDWGYVSRDTAFRYKGVSPCFSLSRTKSNNSGEAMSVGASSRALWVNIEIKSQTPIDDVTFKLTGISDYGTQVSKIMTTDAFGRLIFDDVEIGEYELIEVKPNDDFIQNMTVWNIKVNEDRTVEISSLEENRDRLYETSKDDSETYDVIYNEPRYWKFTLRKVDAQNNTIWLEGAQFTLTGISDLNTEYDVTAHSNENGRVVFERIEKGTYILKETVAPSGVDEQGHIGGNRNYLPNNKEYIVEIDHLGNVNISGLNMNDYDDFEFLNARAMDGKITITKIWKDSDPSDRVAPVVHLSTAEPEGLAKIIVTYDANGGSFTNSNINKVLYRGTYANGTFTGNLSEGEILEPTKEGYTFEGWYLDKDFTTPYTGDISNGQSRTVYAKWQYIPPTTKYAVQIYGIGQDENQNGEKMGLTFGPALGQDFMNNYISHTPSGLTEDENAHRCVHDDTWEEIVYWNSVDPYVYEQCVRNNCTHSVNLTFPDYLKNTSFIYGGSSSGDGVGSLYNEFNDQQWHSSWNPINNGTKYGTNKDGWGASRIRAMMNGYDELTMTKGSYNYYDSYIARIPETNYVSGKTLLDAFPQILQDNIGARKTLYDSVYNQKTTDNLKTTYDKLWLLSPNEMTNDNATLLYNGPYDHYQHPLEASKGKYQKFIESNVNLSTSSKTAFRAYRQNGNTGTSGTVINWWLRSSYGDETTGVLYVGSGGGANVGGAYYSLGVSPCFALNTTYEFPRPGTIRYAVQIYGIGQDEDQNGNTMGLTFGPALGQNFMHTYIKHTPTRTTSLGNAHRCVHDDNWETIVHWNKLDPAVYEQCIANNCTHSVDLTLSDTLKNPNFVYGGSSSGDGVGQLYHEFTDGTTDYPTQHVKWNPLQSSDSTLHGTTYGGWGASRIRAMMNGADSLTTTGENYGTYQDNSTYFRMKPAIKATDYTGSDTLLAAFPQILQDNIGARKTLYDSVYSYKTEGNLKASYDKLWLLSPNEMTNNNATLRYNSQYDYSQHPLESNGGYQKFLQNSQYLKAYRYTGSSDTAYYYNDYFKTYRQNGNTATSGTNAGWWLRSSDGMRPDAVVSVNSYGYVASTAAYFYSGVSPCFALSR